MISELINSKALTGLTHLKVFIPGYNFFPLSMSYKWLREYYNRIVYANEARKEAIPDLKAFRKKVAKPLLKVYPEFLNPNFTSRSALSANEIIAKHAYNIKRPEAAKRYHKHSELKYQTRDGIPAKYIKDKLPLGAISYTEKMSFGTWCLTGSLNPKRDKIPVKDCAGKSPLSIIVGWLSGDVLIPEYLRKQDELIAGGHYLITKPSRLQEFQVELRTRLRRALHNIQASRYALETVQKENERTNQLVDGYKRSGIASFKVNGSSCLNFIIYPETTELLDGLNIIKLREQIRHYFLGKDTKPSESIILPPGSVASDFIGKHGPHVLVDMHLEIKVSGSQC
jgi:hypothetical protein